MTREKKILTAMNARNIIKTIGQIMSPMGIFLFIDNVIIAHFIFFCSALSIVFVVIFDFHQYFLFWLFHWCCGIVLKTIFVLLMGISTFSIFYQFVWTIHPRPQHFLVNFPRYYICIRLAIHLWKRNENKRKTAK